MHFRYTEKVVPYVRMTQRGKFVKANAQAYLASKAALSLALKNQMQHKGLTCLPKQRPFRVVLSYSAPNAYQFDLDNSIKAVLDAAQGVVFPDDRWCQCLEAYKTKGRAYQLNLVLSLSEEESV